MKTLKFKIRTWTKGLSYMLLTKEQAPWVDYLEIDEETDERTLSPDAPDNVKKAYEEHLKWKQSYIDKGMKIPK